MCMFVPRAFATPISTEKMKRKFKAPSGYSFFLGSKGLGNWVSHDRAEGTEPVGTAASTLLRWRFLGFATDLL